MSRKTATALQQVNTTPVVKHAGGSIILWECFSVAEIGRMVRIERKTNAAKYGEDLAKNLF